MSTYENSVAVTQEQPTPFRILGKKAGVVTLIIDMLKGTLATLLPVIFGLHGLHPIIFGLCAVIGHAFPIFAHFKGGKVVATSGGVILGYQPVFFVTIILVFLIFLYLSSMVSFASMAVATYAMVAVVFFPMLQIPIVPKNDPLFMLIVLALGVFIWVRHKDNISRIINGTENRVSFGLHPAEKK